MSRFRRYISKYNNWPDGWDKKPTLYHRSIFTAFGEDVDYHGIICPNLDTVYTYYVNKDITEWATTDSGDRVQVILRTDRIEMKYQCTIKDYTEWHRKPFRFFDERTMDLDWMGKKYLMYYNKTARFCDHISDAIWALDPKEEYDVFSSDRLHMHDYVKYNDFSKFPFIEHITHDYYRIVPTEEALTTAWDENSNMYRQVRRYKTNIQKINLVASTIHKYKEYKSLHSLVDAMCDFTRNRYWQDYQNTA